MQKEKQCRSPALSEVEGVPLKSVAIEEIKDLEVRVPAELLGFPRCEMTNSWSVLLTESDFGMKRD